MAQKPVLGKGLASLLPGAVISTPIESLTSNSTSSPVTGTVAIAAGRPVLSGEIGNHDRHPGIALAYIDDISVNHYQPRRDFDEQALEDLAQSIRTNGIIQPLVVRKTAQGYQLIAGERRLRASKKAGLKQVPIVIRKSTDREALELALIENIQRQDLNCIDTALAYLQLTQDFALTQEEVAHRVGKDRASVANHLRLLRLPEAIIDDLKKQILSFGHGKALLSLEDNDLRLEARRQVVEKRLSVRDTESLVEALKNSSQPSMDSKEGSKISMTPIASRLENLSQTLTRRWSAKVEIKGSEKKGKITIHYKTAQDLDRLLQAMQNESIWQGQ